MGDFLIFSSKEQLKTVF